MPACSLVLYCLLTTATFHGEIVSRRRRARGLHAAAFPRADDLEKETMIKGVHVAPEIFSR